MIISYLLSFFWNTRAFDTFIGLFAFFFLFAISSFFNLPVLHQIMILLTNVALIAIIVIFQPELRVALSKLNFKGKRQKQILEFDQFLDHLTRSVYGFSEKGIGALLAIENEDSLQEYALKGIALNAEFSPELLDTIFITSSPLHDGCLIIRDNTCVAAGVILPLSEGATISKAMGTRHRAAIGLSEVSDAIVIVISEETSYVSIARDGIIYKNLKQERFKAILRSIFSPNKVDQLSLYKQSLQWIRK